MNKRTLDRIIGVLFFMIISYAVLFWGIKVFTKLDPDVPLKGYTDRVEIIPLSLGNYWSGDFQDSFTSKVDTAVPLRGCIVRTYNSIKYALFNLGNRPIGNNGSIFEDAYINCTFALGDYDFSSYEKQQQMRNMVDHMVSANDKLERFGKHLFVYIAPGKSSFYPEDVPVKYAPLKKKGAVNSVNLLRKMMSTTDIPYVFCQDYKDELEYPPFYPTGIHWSRTYEQLCSQKLIDEMGKAFGKNYRNIEFTGVEESTEPFVRETDVYDLLNIWKRPNTVFYRYSVISPAKNGNDELNMVLVGDSFGEGLLNDISDNLPEDNTAYIIRDDRVTDYADKSIELQHDWDKMDWQQILDCSDIVVIEMVEPEVAHFTYGFVQHLDEYLNSYQPVEKNTYYPDRLDYGSEESFDVYLANGLYGKENGYAWIKPTCCIHINDREVSTKGLEITYVVPEQVFSLTDTDVVKVYINDRLAAERSYSTATYDSVIIPADQLGETGSGVYTVEIDSSEMFNPKKIGMSDDDRDLALRLEYVGEAR